MFKNKLFVFSLIGNAVCIIVIIILDVVLFNTFQNKEECKTVQQVVSKQIAYHCETESLKDNGTKYTYTRNYDFTFKDNKLNTSSYYVKAMFTDKLEYTNFTAKQVGKDTELKSKQDDEKLIKYYSFCVNVKHKDETLEEYIKKVEETEKMTCKEEDKSNLIFF